jgi:pSer/pThr/pTyr-binding forkhead associated (FHA) protein
MAKLVLTLEGKVINHYFIDKPCLTIGRGAGNDIVINDPLLSREHARIVSIGEDEIVEDLQSSNGTRINGSPLVRQILQHRDIIELGNHQLRYMSSRIASDVDFERTMMIQTLPRQAEAGGDAPIFDVPVARSAKTRFQEGSVTVLAGSRPYTTDQIVRLDRVVTTFGVPGEQLVVLTRRPQGVFLTHVEGSRFPRVNRQSVGETPHLLRDGDLIEAAGYQLKFKLKPLTDR